MPGGVNFSEDAAKRIVRAVKRSEQQSRGGARQPNGKSETAFRLLLKAVADESIAAGGEGTFIVWKEDSGGSSATTEEIEAKDWLETGFAEGDRAYIICIFDEETKYFAIRKAGSTVWGYLAGSLSQGASATLNVCSFDGSDNQIDTGETVTVWDVLLNDGETAIPAETRGIAHVDATSGRWIFGAANCEAEATESLPQEEE